MCAVAQYYDISPKADRGDIFIVHDQKSSYRTPYFKPGAEPGVAVVVWPFGHPAQNCKNCCFVPFFLAKNAFIKA